MSQCWGTLAPSWHPDRPDRRLLSQNARLCDSLSTCTPPACWCCSLRWRAAAAAAAAALWVLRSGNLVLSGCEDYTLLCRWRPRSGLMSLMHHRHHHRCPAETQTWFYVTLLKFIFDSWIWDVESSFSFYDSGTLTPSCSTIRVREEPRYQRKTRHAGKIPPLLVDTLAKMLLSISTHKTQDNVWC